MANHTFYYKILDAAPPHPLPDTLPLSALDAQDGFIHLSTARQTPITADLFFGQYFRLWILKLRVRDLDGDIRFPADLPGCPHVHDSRTGLGRGNVDGVIEVGRREGEKWGDVASLAELKE